MSYFNVRVYGILINEREELLLSDEFEFGYKFTKFPGGGVEFGEGLKEALKREYLEECNFEIEVLDHIYTTDFFEKSAFNESQILSVYYLVRPLKTINLMCKEHVFDFQNGETQCFRWMSLEKLKTADLTFETDRRVLGILKSGKRSF